MEFKDEFKHLSLPVMANLSLGKKIKFLLNGGFFLDYLRKETLYVPAIVFNPQQTGTVELNTMGHKRFDAGVVAGLGLAVPLGEKLNCSLEFRNYFSLANRRDDYKYFSKLYYNYHALYLGLTYKLGKTT